MNKIELLEIVKECHGDAGKDGSSDNRILRFDPNINNRRA